MTLLTGWPLEISVDDILRGQAVDPQVVRAGKPSLFRAAERACTQSQELLHPAAILREIGIRAFRHEQVVLENGLRLTGPLVSSHLAGAQRLVAVASTIGPGLEWAVSAALASDPLYALALDGLGNAAVEMLSQQICAHIGRDLHLEDYTASTPISPGSPDWPVEVGQPQIFSLLDGSKAGISLTSSSMMFPKKSVSFVVGIGHGMSQANLCTLCSLKETCRYQHA